MVAMKERPPIVISPQTGQFIFNKDAMIAASAENRSVHPSTTPFNWYCLLPVPMEERNWQ